MQVALVPKAGKVKPVQRIKEQPVKKEIPKSYNTDVPKGKWLQIDWQNIFFQDFAIKVSYEKSYSKPFRLSESRKSFKYLTKYLLSLKREPIEVFLVGNEIKEIKILHCLKMW